MGNNNSGYSTGSTYVHPKATTFLNLFVAYKTGNDKTGKIYSQNNRSVTSNKEYIQFNFSDGQPPKSSDIGVFKTFDAAYDSIKDTLENNTIECTIFIFDDIENRALLNDNYNALLLKYEEYKNINIVGIIGQPCLIPKFSTVTFNNILISSCLCLRNDPNESLKNYTLVKGTRLIPNNAFLINIPEKITTYPAIEQINNNNVEQVVTPFVTVPKGEILYMSDVYFVNTEGAIFEDITFIDNNGTITGLIPSVQLKGDNLSITTLINNTSDGIIAFEGNTNIQNTIMSSSNNLCLINQEGLNNKNNNIQVNLENVELSIDLPSESILFSMENNGHILNKRAFNFIRCNFKRSNQANKMILSTNTTQYRAVDCITGNIILPTCSADILHNTNRCNKECMEMRPDVTAKFNGSNISNTSTIIAPELLKEDTNIDDMFINDATIYYVDTSNGNINIKLPKYPQDGYMVTFKKYDNTSNKVHIIAPKETSIEGVRCIKLKSYGNCKVPKTQSVKLHYFNGTYYILC